jgi:phosphohistidine phosphatase SixA
MAWIAAEQCLESVGHEPANDPGLTQAGMKRAQDLVTALGDTGVTGIITTQMRRTQETAKPLATKIGVTPEVVKIPADDQGHVSRDLSSHLAALQAALHHYAGGVVLVVGHDNSAPELIAAFGGPKHTELLQDSLRQLVCRCSKRWKAALRACTLWCCHPGRRMQVIGRVPLRHQPNVSCGSIFTVTMPRRGRSVSPRKQTFS